MALVCEWNPIGSCSGPALVAILLSPWPCSVGASVSDAVTSNSLRSGCSKVDFIRSCTSNRKSDISTRETSAPVSTLIERTADKFWSSWNKSSYAMCTCVSVNLSWQLAVMYWTNVCSTIYKKKHIKHTKLYINVLYADNIQKQEITNVQLNARKH